ncbi:hypothetical protein AK812_SmicGene2227 [Symbiodinium microadriaticum]|uniref:RING-type domain-containing protein n=1 Tax=Symbiodinium microadriaticum TaxID=2951 RepID=A0A1Q9F1Z6_SYMMI|nr:hypothetical protein AK812_SmicGene2227 [Symbiodinium microadriaticum]
MAQSSQPMAYTYLQPRTPAPVQATAAAPLMVQGHGCACAAAASTPGQSVVYLRPANALAGPAQHRMPVASLSRYTYTRPPVLDRSASGRSNTGNIARQAIDSMQRTAFEALSINVPTFNCKICFENLPLTERSTFMDCSVPDHACCRECTSHWMKGLISNGQVHSLLYAISGSGMENVDSSYTIFTTM